jgi:hypothetical protein
MQIYMPLLPNCGTNTAFLKKEVYFHTIYRIFSKFVTKIFGNFRNFHTFAIDLFLNLSKLQNINN